MPQRRYLARGFVERRFHWHRAPAPQARIDRDRGDGIPVVQARGDRGGAEAGEERERDAPEAREGEERGGGLRHHRHVQTHRVAWAQPELREPIGKPAGLGMERRVAPGADLSILGLPDDRRMVASRRRDMPVEAR